MADFIEQSNTKIAVRELAAPIADIATFNTLVSGVVSGNPWSCTTYEVGGVAQPAVDTSREAYTAKVLYEDEAAKTVGTAQAKCPSVAAFNTAIANMLANAALATAMGGDVVRDSENETYTRTLKCHFSNGEIVYVTFSREQVRVSSYSDDAILTTIDTWADTKTELA
jgi:coenzyme F420-reducing hydrogenase alpha subunit